MASKFLRAFLFPTFRTLPCCIVCVCHVFCFCGLLASVASVCPDFNLFMFSLQFVLGKLIIEPWKFMWWLLLFLILFHFACSGFESGYPLAFRGFTCACGWGLVVGACGDILWHCVEFHSQSESTALMLSAALGHTDCVWELIDSGAEKEANDWVRARVGRCFAESPSRLFFILLSLHFLLHCPPWFFPNRPSLCLSYFNYRMDLL